jgi:hypothetical protein
MFVRVLRSFALVCCIATSANAAGVTFELNSNKVYIPVRVNGKGPYPFILDTGSISNVVDAERAKSLGIVTSGKSETRGAGEGSLPSSTGKNVDLSANGAATGKQDVEILPINNAVSFSEGHLVNGLLGYPFFQRFVVEIDYGNKQVSFHEPSKFQYTGQGEQIPFEIKNGNIFIRANVVLPNSDRITGKFLVDTGWRAALSLNSPFVRDHKLRVMTATIVAMTGVGIGGPVTDAIGRISTLEIGRNAIKNPVASFSEASSGIQAQNDFAGIIGAEILRRFTVVFDYPQRRMFLQPNAHFDEPYDFDMSGLYVTAEGKDFRTFKIFKVTPNSPGDAAGLREGDQIWAISNQPATKLTLEQIRQMFRQEGKEYSIGVLRGDNMVQTKLLTRRQI